MVSRHSDVLLKPARGTHLPPPAADADPRETMRSVRSVSSFFGCGLNFPPPRLEKSPSPPAPRRVLKFP